MSEPTKDNAHILADQQAFMNAYDRAREVFGKIEGVAGVGFGQKETSGEFKNDVAIIVWVNEKKDENELPPEQRIPPTFEGYRTDVRVVLKVVPGICDNNNNFEVIEGGIQIVAKVANDGSFESGTLGCIVKKRGDAGRENVYLLSNKHVLYSKGAGAGDYIHHPFAPPPPGTNFVAGGEARSLGPIQAPAFYENVTATVPDVTPGTTVQDTFFIDCAFARINIDSKCGDSTCTKDTLRYQESITGLQLHGVNTLSDVRSIARDPSIVTPVGDSEAGRPRVFKVGRTTGRTVGIVRSVNATLNTVGDPSLPNPPPMVGQNVIEISFDQASEPTHVNCKGHAWFAQHGDSGSILVDEDNRVIGIIQGVPDDTDPNVSPTASSAACHILPVLDKLGICIPVTTGTSHGSSRATDGSGIGPAILTPGPGGLGPGDFPIPDGEIRFAAAGQSAVALAGSPGFPDPVPISDDELDQMRDLVAALRTTAKGRELHDTFGYVRREIGYLIRNCRPVKVVWHRNQGPAFFAHVLNHLRGYTVTVPHEINGIPGALLLTRMADVLSVHGSNPLRMAIEKYRGELLPVVPNLHSAQDCIAYLREKENS
jgi:hypothetical protein